MADAPSRVSLRRGRRVTPLADYAQAREYLEQCLAIGKELGDRELEGLSLESLGVVSESLSNYAQAREYHGQSLTIYRALGNRAREEHSLGHLGDVSMILGDYAQTRGYFE